MLKHTAGQGAIRTSGNAFFAFSGGSLFCATPETAPRVTYAYKSCGSAAPGAARVRMDLARPAAGIFPGQRILFISV